MPQETERSVPLSQVAVRASESAEKDPRVRYNDFIKRGRAAYDRRWRTPVLDKQGAVTGYEHRSGDIPEQDHNIIQSYYELLCTYPELDDKGTVRALLSVPLKKPIGAWRRGGSVYDQRDTLLDAIGDHLRSLDDRYYALNPIDRTKQKTEKFWSGEESSFGPSGLRYCEERRGYLVAPEHLTLENDLSASAIHVVFNGKDQELKAITAKEGGSASVATPFTIDGLGTFTCRSTLKMEDGKAHSEYQWSFIGQTGAKCYVYRTNAQGIEQPGKWMQTQEKPTEEIAWRDGDQYIYPSSRFHAEVFLKNGQVVKGSTPKELKDYLAVVREGGENYFDLSSVYGDEIVRVILTSSSLAKRTMLKVVRN